MRRRGLRKADRIGCRAMSTIYKYVHGVTGLGYRGTAGCGYSTATIDVSSWPAQTKPACALLFISQFANPRAYQFVRRRTRRLPAPV